MTLFAGSIVLCFGLFFVGLAVLAVTRPQTTKRFLKSFASSAKAHFLEMAIRLTGGVALVLYAPFMHFSTAFLVFGWVLVGTAIVLLVMPWTYHQRFASWAIPFAIRHLRLYVGGSLILGILLLYSVSRGYV